MNPRRSKKNTLLVKVRLYLNLSPDSGSMRKSSRQRCSAPATGLGVTRRKNAIPLALVRPLWDRLEEGLILPATAWAGVRSGGFGGQRGGLLPAQSWHAGRHGVIRASEEV